jgi:hypothetical protein
MLRASQVRKDPLHQKISKAFGEVCLICANMIECDSDEVWQNALKQAEVDYAYIDAEKTTYSQLKGLDYSQVYFDTSTYQYAGRITAFEPEWYKKFKECRFLILNNLDKISYSPSKNSYIKDNSTPSYVDDYDFILRTDDEPKEYKQLHDGLYMPDDNFYYVIVINKGGHFDQFCLTRCCCKLKI